MLMEMFNATLKHSVLTLNLAKPNNASVMILVMKITNVSRVSLLIGPNKEQSQQSSMNPRSNGSQLPHQQALQLRSLKKLKEEFKRRNLNSLRRLNSDLREKKRRELEFSHRWIKQIKLNMNLSLPLTRKPIRWRCNPWKPLIHKLHQSKRLKMQGKKPIKLMRPINIDFNCKHKNLRLKLLIRKEMLSSENRKLMQLQID